MAPSTPAPTAVGPERHGTPAQPSPWPRRLRIIGGIVFKFLQALTVVSLAAGAKELRFPATGQAALAGTDVDRFRGAAVAVFKWGLVRAGQTVAGLYGLILVAAYTLQRHLIFFPVADASRDRVPRGGTGNELLFPPCKCPDPLSPIRPPPRPALRSRARQRAIWPRTPAANGRDCVM